MHPNPPPPRTGSSLPSRRPLRAGLLRPLALAVLAALAPAAGRTAESTVTADLSRLGPEISPYIYGQFIEHLGRCIYGGIWAEMLRDRKFLLEPGKSWEVLKPEGVRFEVFHDPAGAYAGDHGLALWLHEPASGHCGVRQGGLGLEAGKEYTGYAILAHAGAPAPVELRLSWGDGEAEGASVVLHDVGAAYRKFPFRFRAGATTDTGSLSLTLAAPGFLWVGCLSLMPADHLDGMRRDTLALFRRLAPPVTRWPGGNFVSGYRWQDGIGDRDRRPPRWERAWEDVEPNDFGLDEFLHFCAITGTEPYIAVNSGLGSVEDAAREVEYANGPADSVWGAVRARNGHPEPHDVRWWGVGNEMYGRWQLGHVSAERYALRHNAFARAMKSKDPSIRLVAVGEPGRWNDVVLAGCAAHMDLLSGHHYTQRRLRVPFPAEALRQFSTDFPRYSGDVAAGVRRLVEDLVRRQGEGASPAVRALRLAVDEWGIVRDWNKEPDGPGIGSFEHYYTLGDAIAVARALHELIRSAGTVAMANWAQAVNVIGTIKTSRRHAVLDPAGHVLALYRAHLGGRLVPVRLEGAAPVDAACGYDERSRTVSLGLVNFSPAAEATVTVRLEGGVTPAGIEAWRIDGPCLGATNIPGEPEAVTTRPLAEPLSLERVPLPPHSVTILRVALAPPAGAFRFVPRGEGSLELREGERPVLAYNHGLQRRPGAPARYDRSSYVHPLWGLDGEVLTDDFPPDHHHHRGVFWAWPHVRAGGEELDLWALGGPIRHRFERWTRREAGAARAVLGVENGWYAGEQRIVREEATITAHRAAGDRRAVDFELTWTALEEPVTLEGAEGKSYGGFTVRFAPREGTTITVPGGVTEKDLAVVRLPWADLTGRFEGAPGPSGIAVFVHPDHPGHPPTWLTRHYGVLCVGWPGVEPGTLEPGKPVRCAYRLWIHRGAPGAAEIARAWAEYSRGP